MVKRSGQVVLWIGVSRKKVLIRLGLLQTAVQRGLGLILLLGMKGHGPLAAMMSLRGVLIVS